MRPASSFCIAEVLRIRHEMAVQSIAVSIEPPFPYDAYEPNARGEFPATEKELDSLMQAIQKRG